MKGTVVMRFVGNRQEPEESIRPESEILWPTEVSKQINEFYQWMIEYMMKEWR